MKNFKKVLALVLVLATLMGFATVAGAAYKDEDQISADYSEAIKVLELIETMEGYPDGTFGPKKTITREEAAKLIAIFDNKDSDISTYYTSINPFADEKGRWGESYVGYGYRAGIIAGMNATTYAPTANVTGTQFLKMALVTLGYDQEAEGFVGSSWAVNVLALAKKIGLIDDLADGWKPEADLTREEAAQILLNTLKANTVEYAQEAKQVGFKPTAKQTGSEVTYTWNGRIYLTVAGAVSTGKQLYKDFDLEVSTSYDAFMRPYTKWTLGKDSVEVMEAPKATFTTRFSACDLLAELGVEKTDTDTEVVIDGVYTNGIRYNSDALMTGNDYVGGNYKITEEYVARPAGSKHPTMIMDQDFGIWSHENSTCKTPSNAKHGAQGTLTQIFYNGKDAEGNKHYYVTSIDTWLAKVKSVTTKTNSRDEHVKQDGAVKLETLWTISTDSQSKDYSENFADYCNETADCTLLKSKHDGTNNILTFDDPTGIAKDDYVLLTYSFKESEVQSLDVVEGKDGRLNGYKFDSVAENPSETRIDGEFVKDAVHFHAGYDISKSNDFGTYTFYYDAYGNVIGLFEAEDTAGWGVADRMWVIFDNKGTTTFNADIVGLDAKTTTAQIEKKTDREDSGEDYAYAVATWLMNLTNGESYKDFKQFYDHLYKFSVDSEGNYTWNEAINNTKVSKNGSLDDTRSSIKITNKTPYMTLSTGAKVTLTSDTEFLVHNMDGTYSAYTGYKNVPSMIAHYVEYVMDEDNKFAEVVYLTNDVYTTDSKFVAYVGGSADQYGLELTVDGTVYYGLDVYVNGEAKTVYIEKQQMLDYFDAPSKFVAGFYQFQIIKIDGEELVRVVKGPKTSDAADLDGNNKYLAEAKAITFFNGTVIELAGDDKTYALTDDCAFYGIWKNDIVETDADEIEDLYDKAVDATLDANADAHKAFVQFNDDDEVTAVYFVLAKND